MLDIDGPRGPEVDKGIVYSNHLHLLDLEIVNGVVGCQRVDFQNGL
jgi:hypothetical protein